MPLIAALVETSAHAQFAAPAETVLGERTYRPDFADIDGDGDLDIVTTDSSGDVDVYTNLGNMQFGPPLSFAAPGTDRYWAVHCLDADQDGDLDLFVAGRTEGQQNWTGYIQAFRNDGPGQYVDLGRIVEKHEISPTIRGSADFDGDGGVDMFGSLERYEAIAIYQDIQIASGPASFVDGPALNPGDKTVVVDLDMDGDIDLIRMGPFDVTWFENISTGGSALQFGAEQHITTFPDILQEIRVADLDDDGDLDIVFFRSGLVGTMEGLGGGSFGAQQPAFIAAGWIHALVLGDVNSDGDLDIVALTPSVIQHSENLGALQFGHPSAYASPSPVQWGLHVGDIDGDGDTDLLSVGNTTAQWPDPGLVVLHENVTRRDLGSSECGPAPINSAGLSGALRAHGRYSVQAQDVELFASSLPAGTAGIFLASPAAGHTPNLGGGVGTLCLGQPIYRLPGVFLSGHGGSFDSALDFQALPGTIFPFSTWRFQAWHRDGGNGSNLTNAIAIQFVP